MRIKNLHWSQNTLLDIFLPFNAGMIFHGQLANYHNPFLKPNTNKSHFVISSIHSEQGEPQI